MNMVSWTSQKVTWNQGLVLARDHEQPLPQKNNFPARCTGGCVPFLAHSDIHGQMNTEIHTCMHSHVTHMKVMRELLPHTHHSHYGGILALRTHCALLLD